MSLFHRMQKFGQPSQLININMQCWGNILYFPNQLFYRSRIVSSGLASWFPSLYDQTWEIAIYGKLSTTCRLTSPLVVECALVEFLFDLGWRQDLVG